MNRIFILAFVLFATLFAVNAAPLELVKRETKFPPCPDAPPDVVGFDVKMTPDPFVSGQEETFEIKGTLKKDVVAGDFLGIGFVDLVAKAPILGDPLIVDICTVSGITCPIKAGTAFSTTQKYTAPSAQDLPEAYAIVIALEHGQPPDIELLACSAALFGANESSAVPDFWSL